MTAHNKIKQSNETVYLKGLSRLSGERRLEITSELHEVVKEVAKAGIKHQNPHIAQGQLRLELAKRFNK